MKRLSQAISTAGLLGLAVGVLYLPGTAEDGAAVYRWHWLGLGLAFAGVCFWGAGRLRRNSDG